MRDGCTFHFLSFPYGSGPSCIYAGPRAPGNPTFPYPFRAQVCDCDGVCDCDFDSASEFPPDIDPDVLVSLRTVSTTSETRVPDPPRRAP